MIRTCVRIIGVSAATWHTYVHGERHVFEMLWGERIILHAQLAVNTTNSLGEAQLAESWCQQALVVRMGQVASRRKGLDSVLSGHESLVNPVSQLTREVFEAEWPI